MMTKEVRCLFQSVILDEFRASTKSSEWTGIVEQFRISQELRKVPWDGNTDKVAELAEKTHNKAENKTCHEEARLAVAELASYAAQ